MSRQHRLGTVDRGCHTALREVHRKWNGTVWFIEGDISQYFDNLDHEVLLGMLAEKIHDGRFLNLVAGLLRAGYLEDWRFNRTLSGTPQGASSAPSWPTSTWTGSTNGSRTP